MNVMQFFLSALRVINRKLSLSSIYTDKYCDYKDQAANNIIKEKIHAAFIEKKGLMLGKFGTYELDTTLFFHCNNKTLKAINEEIHAERHIFFNEIQKHLPNTGFFPLDEEYAKKFSNLMLDNLSQVDILASYMTCEKNINNLLENKIKVNLEGYYAPFLWNNPWTKELEGKKILVIHPFAESIINQYKNRDKLFENKEVLPEFKKLEVIKAVQSIAGNKPENFNTWFDALDYMKAQIDNSDFDIALIGCGAYGFPLAAHVKQMGKIAIHLAGWLQMLFGIYGERWIEDQPEYKKFINEYWIRPSDNEKPKNFNKIENGCYW